MPEQAANSGRNFPRSIVPAMVPATHLMSFSNLQELAMCRARLPAVTRLRQDCRP